MPDNPRMALAQRPSSSHQPSSVPTRPSQTPRFPTHAAIAAPRTGDTIMAKMNGKAIAQFFIDKGERVGLGLRARLVAVSR